jgi:alpha-tubulin suppressor-like RCC1 family protein
MGGFKMISVGNEFSLFLNKQGQVFGCGNNEIKQLSYYSPIKQISKHTLITLPEKMVRVFAGNFSAAISEKENIFVWGLFNDEVLSPINPFKAEET